MWDDVSANKSLIGNERETPSTRSQLLAHAWLPNVAIWVINGEENEFPAYRGGFVFIVRVLVEGLRVTAAALAGSAARHGGGSGWRGCVRRVLWWRYLVSHVSPGAQGFQSGCCRGGQQSARCEGVPVPTGSPSHRAGWPGGRGRGAGDRSEVGEAGHTEQVLMLEKGEVRGRT